MFSSRVCLPACLRLFPTVCVFPLPFPRLLVFVYLCQGFRSYNTRATLKFHLSFDDVSRFHPRYFCVKFHHLPLFQISMKSLFLQLLVCVRKICSRSRKIFQLKTLIFRNFEHDFNKLQRNSVTKISPLIFYVYCNNATKGMMYRLHERKPF